ncbi:MAG: phosphoribosyl-AMP cyclohydrolase [Nitriliruptoraceae bacterium]
MSGDRLPAAPRRGSRRPGGPTAADPSECPVSDPSSAVSAERPERPEPPPAVSGVADLRFDAAGLVPVVVQQYDSGEVLMVAWADRAALTRALEIGEAVFYSRSRREQWHKGATSGNTQRLVEVRIDCDADVVLYLVDQGADHVACHTGQRSCFHRHLADAPTGPSPAAPPLVAPKEPAP